MSDNKNVVVESGEPGAKDHGVAIGKAVSSTQESQDIQSQAESHEAHQSQKLVLLVAF
tara:strand:- start:1186 stop:1359 length:174 start_codon:yes stop_codon:yes gene_type:complete